jgi:hypothetical protein
MVECSSILRGEEFDRDSDGDDAFGGGSIEQTGLIRHRVNELFGFERA